MVQLASPVPYASTTPGLPFGATNVKPYSRDRPHMGKDWKWSTARPGQSKQVVAPAAGIIRTAFNDGGHHLGWGNYVLIQITDRAQVRLAHHQTGTVKVREGQKVALDQPIGVMGDTGETNGVHLHEELLIDGIRVDPDLYRAPHGRHLPGRPVIAPPKPAPASNKPKPATPAITPEEEDMTVYVQAKGDKVVYEVKDGRRRRVDSGEWEVIKSAFTAAGRKLPYSKGKQNLKQVQSIPELGK